MKKKGNIEDTIQNVCFDMKAEAVIGDLMENGLGNEDFVVVHNGTFRRGYSRDIAFTNKIKLNNGQELVGIHVNRDAIYDTLPEGLFHQKSETNTSNVKNVSGESKKLKAEEKAARNFFLPFENELFFQRINLELEERKILHHFNENLFDDISPEFWNIDPSLDRQYVSGMVKFLHFSHKIAGNTKLTAKCLEAIIHEDVAVKVVENHSAIKGTQKEDNAKNCLLGASRPGVDFVCGDTCDSMGFTIHFDIGPLKNTHIADYLENRPVSNFLKCFFGYFIPAELEVSADVYVAKEKQGFSFETEGEGLVLGYNTAI
jgi:hypothetical protein